MADAPLCRREFICVEPTSAGAVERIKHLRARGVLATRAVCVRISGVANVYGLEWTDKPQVTSEVDYNLGDR